MTIKFSLSTSSVLSQPVDVAVIGVEEAAKPKLPQALGKALGVSLDRALKREHFTGKKDQVLELSSNGKLKATKVLLVGVGKTPLTSADVRAFAAKAARYAQGAKGTTLAVQLPEGKGYVRAATEGVVLGSYRFTKYLTGDRLPKTSLGKVSLTVAKVTADQKAELSVGQHVGESICIARDLINEPPNELYPDALARAAAEMSKKAGLTCTVMDKAALVKKGMNLIVAVGQGSHRDPRLVHMVYTPKDTSKATRKKLVFVGKGLTFDSGGLCIKPAGGMEDMKGDMGGAANVVALMAAVAATKPNVEVHGIIGCAENMPGGGAYRPADIFKSYDGKTVEIINTDAEGRLVLADVLAYGAQLKPDLMLDNATLTGACMVALGPSVSGFFASTDELAEHVRAASKDAGEAMWQLPLVEELRDGLKSDWADLKHTAERWGGAISAALFLREFTAKTPWVHVDIAGPSMATRANGIYSKGGTGHGVLTYLALIDRLVAAE